jgi:hypothetical protein
LETIVVFLDIVFEELGYVVGRESHVVETVHVGHAVNEPLVSNDAAEGFLLGKWEIGKLQRVVKKFPVYYPRQQCCFWIVAYCHIRVRGAGGARGQVKAPIEGIENVAFINI